MTSVYDILRKEISNIFLSSFNQTVAEKEIIIEPTNPDFQGDLTIIIFPLLRYSHKSVDITANIIVNELVKRVNEIESFEIIKGFLNLTFQLHFWNKYLKSVFFDKDFVNKTTRPLKYLIEFSSPNTNKPLHLGHIRNNLIGHSVSEILKFRGNYVVKINLINDRGIHICKSMLAWMKYGKGETPETSNLKGDHLIGKYYVLFEKYYRKEVQDLIESGLTQEVAEKEAPLIKEAQKLLHQWEQGDNKVLEVWKLMNSWVYDGFKITYKRMGVNFDKTYYESDTYLLGKKIVVDNLNKGYFYKKPDDSVWIDLKEYNLDDKLLLRSDGTSVYITQDLGTAWLKENDYHPDKSIYVVGDEQVHHFNILKLILKKIDQSYWDTLYHLSYGMVDLPTGKMKSREGTVVDADVLMEEMNIEAEKYILNSDKVSTMTDEERKEISEIIAIGALKFFILKTDSKKRMTFNPEESIDFQGFTGPFIQYTYARIRSIFRKGNINLLSELSYPDELIISDAEKKLILKLYHFNSVIEEAEITYEPSVIANYVYHLAKLYNQFYHDFPVLKEQDQNKKNFRIILSYQVSEVIQISMNLLGIIMPEKM